MHASRWSWLHIDFMAVFCSWRSLSVVWKKCRNIDLKKNLTNTGERHPEMITFKVDKMLQKIALTRTKTPLSQTISEPIKISQLEDLYHPTIGTFSQKKGEGLCCQ
ncbi:hypothetical protein DAI22_06g248800 [Oryza sativa Japonica Group]|nr:hypothetical protein DAI22_06g248800 [Oryza sativa Japonica Group]